MAKKVTVTIIDDVDGQSVAAETVSFGLDGVSYTIDLSDKNAKKLRDVLEPWVSSATKVGGRRKSGVSPAKVAAKVDKEQLGPIREWARSNGYEVSPRGRVPQHIIDAYNSKER
jgi:hypothetical protein